MSNELVNIRLKLAELINQNTHIMVKKANKVRKMMLILSKATLDNVYACFILANGARMEGIESEIFFTFFGLEAVNKAKLNDLHIATVGNPAMGIPSMIGGLPGVEAMATKMMKGKIEDLDIPPIDEFLEILTASGTKLWACKLAMDMFDLEESDLIEDIDGVLTVGDFYERAEGEGTHVVFI